MEINKRYLERLLETAIDEDIAFSGDITSENIFERSHISKGRFISKEEGIFCGEEILRYIFKNKVKDGEIEIKKKDGEYLQKGDIIAKVKGNTKDILLFERTCLNIICHMSGIANKTMRLVKALNRADIRVVDTRKTLPGLRALQKYAVKIGGGYNHRSGLYDAVMIKENHIKAAGSIKEAVEKVRRNVSHVIKIEVETTDLKEVHEAVEAGADIIMLDNMEHEQMSQACIIINRRALIEISGNISDDNIKERVKELPVDIISSGALTHSVKVFDISFLLD